MRPNLEAVKATLGRFDFPKAVIVETTAFCNLRCVMCPQPYLKRMQGVMEFTVFKKIVDEIAKESPTTDLWLAIMGEPLTRGEELVRMVAYAKQQGLKKIHLNSNGQLLSRKLSEQLIESGLDEIIIGMDGITQGVYGRVRVGGIIERLIENIEGLKNAKIKANKNNPHIILQFIVMDENEKELDLFKQYGKKHGLTLKIRPKLGWGTGVEANNLNLPDSERTFPCGWLIRTMSIHWSGRVAQCDADYEGLFSPGDIREQSLKEIWNGELATRREKHWSGDFAHELCSKCRDWQAGRSEFFDYPSALDDSNQLMLKIEHSSLIGLQK